MTEEVLEFGRRRLPRWIALPVLLAVALVAALVANAGRTSRPDPVLAAAAASVRAPLVGYVRPEAAAGACPLVPVGTDPQRALGAQVVRELPGYRVVDTAATLDELTALCAVQLRAVNARGDAVRVDVTAPQHLKVREALAQKDGTSHGIPVRLLTATGRDGWTVTVTALGGGPSATELTRLARDPSLRW